MGKHKAGNGKPSHLDKKAERLNAKPNVKNVKAKDLRKGAPKGGEHRK